MLDHDRVDRIARKHNGLKTEVTKRARVVQSELMSIDDKIDAISPKLEKTDEKLDVVINCLKCLSVVGIINLIALVVFHG